MAQIPSNQLLRRVSDALGPTAATMYLERGKQRHFIGEAAILAVAIYLVGKYLDGVIEGLGIPDAGKKHGKAIREAIAYGASVISGDRPPDETTTRDAESKLEQVIEDLRTLDLKEAAGNRARRAVSEDMTTVGIPDFEADRISDEVAESLWKH